MRARARARTHVVRSYTSASGVGSPLNERSSRGSVRRASHRAARHYALPRRRTYRSPVVFLFSPSSPFLCPARDSQWGDIPFHSPSVHAHVITDSQAVTTGIGSVHPAELEHFDTGARPLDANCKSRMLLVSRFRRNEIHHASSMEKLLRH